MSRQNVSPGHAVMTRSRGTLLDAAQPCTTQASGPGATQASRSPAARASRSPAAQPSGPRAAIGQLVLTLVLLAISGCGHHVVRISDGTSRTERSIDARAYAAFARGRLRENAGDRKGAIESYREVLRLDTGADEAWVRLGAIACGESLEAARSDFAQAAKLRPTSATRSLAEARCLLAHGDLERAQSAVEAAMRLSPEDPEPSRLTITILFLRRRAAEAARFAWAHVAAFPNDTIGWLLLAHVVDASMPLRQQISSRALQRSSPNGHPLVLPPDSKSLPIALRLDPPTRARMDLEHGLASGDDRLSQRAARELRLSIVQLAARAQELGSLQFARKMADIAGVVQPNDVAIWLRRLDLADRLRDEDAFDSLLRHPPIPPSPLDADDSDRLLTLVMRRTGFNLPQENMRAHPGPP